MSRSWKILLLMLAAFLIVGLFSLPALLRNVSRLRRATANEDQAHRAIVQAQVSTPGDVQEKAQLFWASATSPGTLEASEVELPLASDPVQRAKQLLTALIAQAPSDDQRTLPADAELLDFYLLPDGTAIADFSETLGTKTPSGIFSEDLAVNSILRTLGANVPKVHSLKILIHGQEADTLAGHVDLTGFFAVPSSADATGVTDTSSSAAAPATASATAAAAPAAAAPVAAASSGGTKPATAAPVPATAPPAPVARQ